MYYPILVNAKRIVGNSVGYLIGFEGPTFGLTFYRRDSEIPEVNTNTPLITSEEALKAANQTFPTVKDAEHQNWPETYTFGKPMLVYCKPNYADKTARLAWYMTCQHIFDTRLGSKGGIYAITIDAVTGKYIKTEHMISALP